MGSEMCIRDRSMELPDHRLTAVEGLQLARITNERQQAVSVEAVGVRGSCDITEGGKPVGEIARSIVGRSRAGQSRPAHDAWHSHSSLVDASLESAETGSGIEKVRIDAAHTKVGIPGTVGGPIVRSEDDNGVLDEVMLLEPFQDRSNMLIEI